MLPHMVDSAHNPFTEDQLEVLEAFDRALDDALDASIDPACLHAVIDTRVSELRLTPRPRLRPTGWLTITGSRIDTRRVGPTPGTLEAHNAIFHQAPALDRQHAAEKLRAFRRAASSALKHGWRHENLHRIVDAAHWTNMAELYGQAGAHAWAATIAAPPHPLRAA